MKATFVFGHRNPDTDTVCSSIALANLRNQLGENAIPRVLGDLNAETEFVLNYFKVKKPKYLNDVRLQIRDLEYGKGLYCHQDDGADHSLGSIYHASVLHFHRSLHRLFGDFKTALRIEVHGAEEGHEAHHNPEVLLAGNPVFPEMVIVLVQGIFAVLGMHDEERFPECRVVRVPGVIAPYQVFQHASTSIAFVHFL